MGVRKTCLKSILGGMILLAGMAIHAEPMQFLPMDKPQKITVFVAKKFVTMDPAIPTATAVAISDGKILSVGSLLDLKPWLDKYPYEITRQFAD